MLEMVNISDNSSKQKGKNLKYKKSKGVEIKDYLLLENNEEEDDQSNYKQKYFSIKEKYEFLKIIVNGIKEFVGLILFCVAYYYYYLSLEKCLKGQENCSLLIDWQFDKVHQEVKSCILTVFILEFLFYNLLSKLHLIHFLLVFLAFYKYSHGVEFDDHGYYNFIYFFIIVFLLIIFLLPLNFIIYVIRKTNDLIYLLFYILFLIIIILSLYFLIIMNGSNCKDWGKGLNDTSIINNKTKYGCRIIYPKKCTYKPIYFFQDYTKILGKNCAKMIKDKSRENLIKKSKSPYINSTTKHFGYPLSNKDPDCIAESNRNTLQSNFLNNLVDMDNEESLKNFTDKMPEVSVDFTDNIQGKMEINVHYNESLSQERKLLETNSEPLSNNVLVIYVDSVSRQNANRELKNTLKFFEKFMPYSGGFNEKYPNEIYHSFEFFKYHAFKGYTSVNYPLLFYGQNRKVKKKFLINKYFKENGYVTGLAHDYCWRDNTLSNHNFIKEEVFDHEFNLCDPNQENVNINTVRCLYGKQDIEHLLNYTDQFWRKYKDNRKFALLVSNYGHEGTLQAVKHIDIIISDFLINLFNDNLLKDTTVFLISDHGSRMPSLYYVSDFYNIEAQLPMLYIMVNDRKNFTYEQQYQYMHENQQNFITAFDFYNTLSNIIFGDKYEDIRNKTNKIETCKSPHGESLFNKIHNNKDRYPKKYNQMIKMAQNACK